MGRTKPIVKEDYVVGLTDGEGCFHVNLWKSPSYKAGFGVQLQFLIKMQENDKPLLDKIKNTLQCGEVYIQKETRANHVQCYRYTVNSHRDILEVIIPFFQKHPLQSVTKAKSFAIFCKIAALVADGEHLKGSGIKKIKILKPKMNQKTIGLA